MATGVHYITMLLADYITIFFVLQFLHSLVPRPECAPTGVHLGPASFIVKMLCSDGAYRRRMQFSMARNFINAV